MYLCVIHTEVKRNNRKSETDVMFRLVSMTWVNYKQVLEGSGGRLYGNSVSMFLHIYSDGRTKGPEVGGSFASSPIQIRLHIFFLVFSS